MALPEQKPALICETSWEVCNKIGGIYTVLSTKAKTLQECGGKVIYIGPDVASTNNFEPSKTLLRGWKEKADLPFGLTVKVGRWKVPGNPIAVLVDFKGIYNVLDDFKGEMWNRFGVDSLHSYGDYDEGCAFALAAGIVVESLANYFAPTEPVIAHFDEWTTAMGLLFLKWRCPRIATVFTTHATCIGRSICGNGKPLYDYLAGYNGDQMSRELNMESKHSLEKAAAREADCFTTVSDVTATEARQLLDTKDVIVTPNGFEGDFVPKGKKLAETRAKARKHLLEIASALTGKQYDEHTVLIATSGRLEYRNKGIDMFMDSIAALNSVTSKAVVAFVLVPAWTKGPREDLKERLLSGEKADTPLFDPVSTHEVHNPNDDVVLRRIHELGLNNGKDKKVDVIYVPTYLNGDDGIFNAHYYEVLPGFNATVFASYYEPWGYTPMESVAFGVPTVTTSLSGFGKWVIKHYENTFATCGVNVIYRNDSNYRDAVDDIVSSLRFLTLQDKDELTKIARAAQRTAADASWENFIEDYREAYEIALKNCKQRK